MAKLRCNSCGGEYQSVQADGSLYFHACPPVLDDDGETLIERPNKRDENIVPPSDGRGKARPKAIGAGVTPIGP